MNAPNSAVLSPSARPSRGKRGGLIALAVVLIVAGLAWCFAPWSRGFVEHRMLAPTDIPTALSLAPNGDVWFTIEFSDAIGVYRNGKIERIGKGSSNLEPLGLAAAPDGSVWFTDAPVRKISRRSPDGKFESFALDTPIAKLGKLAIAPDGAVWFAEVSGYAITRLKDGAFKRFIIDSVRGNPYGVAIAPDGTVWATLSSANQLLKISPDGAMQQFDVPTYYSAPNDIAIAPDGAVWFLEFRANKVGRYADGKFTETKILGEKAALTGLGIAPDGSVWFAMLRRHSLGRLRNGEFKEFRLPRKDARPISVAVDKVGNVWYTDLAGYLGMLKAARAKR